jgi:hypothetical protein
VEAEGITMSAEATNWVWKHSEASGSDRLVLLALADFCNEKAQCYASYGTLVKKTRLGQKTVYRSLKSLQSMGEVDQIKQGEFGQTGHLASEWRLPKIQACQTDQHVKLTPLRDDKHVKLTPLACQIDLSTIHNNTDNNNRATTANPQPPELTVIQQPNSLPPLDSPKVSQRKREDVLGKGLTDEQWLRGLGQQNPGIDIPVLFDRCLVWCRDKGKVASRRQFMAFVRNAQKDVPMVVAPAPPANTAGQSAWERELAEIRMAVGG